MKSLELTLEKLLSALECENKELSILFTDNEEIKSLNSAYRNKDKPTDVLSFPVDDELFEESLGDIAISLEQAESQAPDFGNDTKHEILRLLIHGALHLVGYEHEDVSQEEVQRMQSKEDELFDLLAAGF